MVRSVQGVIAELSELGCRLSRRELDQVTWALDPGEAFVGGVDGVYNPLGPPEMAWRHVAVLLSQKQILLVVDSPATPAGRAEITRIPWLDVVSVEYRARDRYLKVVGRGKTAPIEVMFQWETVDEQGFSALVGLVNTMVATRRVEQPSPSAPPGLLDELERLVALREKAAISQEEFEAAKRSLLARS